MIGITKLLCQTENEGDSLRYSQGAQNEKYGVAAGKGPVVVWNCTNTCNLRCRHCYADSKTHWFKEELTTEEAKDLIDDLAYMGVPVLLISGGEPLLREDIFELIAYAKKQHIRSTISTNGTLISPQVAQQLKNNGVGYVGVSIDGLGVINDTFRGVKGSFERAIEGIRNCLAVGQKVGLRFTINRHNFHQIENIFKVIEDEKIPRVCFYHLAYSGRGSQMIEEDITHEEKRKVMDTIIDYTLKLGSRVEVLTVDNHADGPYLYLSVQKRFPELADGVLELLKMNGGNRSGMAIANIDFKGDVHPDQFTQHHTYGNVREGRFSDIWKTPNHPFGEKLRNRKALLIGRCKMCRWLDICNGNLRVRAEAAAGDFWGSDPACYLTDEETRRKVL